MLNKTNARNEITTRFEEQEYEALLELADSLGYRSASKLVHELVGVALTHEVMECYWRENLAAALDWPPQAVLERLDEAYQAYFQG